MTTAAPLAVRDKNPKSTRAAGPALTPALRSIIAKELRQNAITVLALLFVAAIVAVIAAFFEWQFNTGYTDRDNMFNIFFLPVTRITVGISLPVLGFILGCAQLRGETGIDAWAFLIHRPVSRLTLFTGRTLAGFLLLLAVAGIPLAILIAYSTRAADGQFFYWRFVLPSFADFLSAFVYYFAGVLIAQNSGFLMGPRILPLIIALSCSMAIHSVANFSSAGAIIVIYSVIFLIAAAGSFYSRGYQLSQPRISRGAQILIACASFAAILYLPCSFAHSSLIQYEDYVLSQGRAPIFFEPTVARTTIQRTLLPDGTLGNCILSVNARTQPSDKHIYTTVYTTLGGIPLPNLTRGQADSMDYSGLQWSNHAPAITLPHRFREVSSLVDKGEADIYDGNTLVSSELWFYVFPEHRFYIQQKQSGTLLGTFGQNGFVPPGALAQPFDVPIAPVAPMFYPLVTTHAIYQINKQKRILKPLLTTPPDEPIIDVEQYIGYAAFTSKHFILDMPGFSYQPDYKDQNKYKSVEKARISLPITHPMDEFEINVRRFPDVHRWSVWYTPLASNKSPDAANYVEFYNDAGMFLQATKLDWVSQTEPPYRFIAPPEIEPSNQAGQALFGLVDGVTLPIVNVWFHDESIQKVHIRTTALYLLSTFGTSAILAILTLLFSRRYNYRVFNAIPWAAATLLFGLPALLAFLATHSLPRRIPCPVCHKRRSISLALCPHCKSPWPAPPATGTEIIGV